MLSRKLSPIILVSFTTSKNGVGFILKQGYITKKHKTVLFLEKINLTAIKNIKKKGNLFFHLHLVYFE